MFLIRPFLTNNIFRYETAIYELKQILSKIYIVFKVFIEMMTMPKYTGKIMQVA